MEMTSFGWEDCSAFVLPLDSEKGYVRWKTDFTSNSSFTTSYFILQ